MGLRSGERAPAFRRVAHDGKTIEVGEGPRGDVLVLYFYPRDETPGCTVEACGFRDTFADFVDAGATVVGVSADSLASHRSFAAAHDLPFSLVSDENGELARAFGVPRTMWVVPGRVTYVIDRENVVRLVFTSQLRARQHIAEALQTVRRLARLRAG